jgi:pyruvate/2-oxoglutarate dehydrogenase complex dihydrolipoamide acyltransferase (E2) component
LTRQQTRLPRNWHYLDNNAEAGIAWTRSCARTGGSTMTTSTTPNQEQQGHGRTVRDVVEHSPRLVNESWCRKILRHVLHQLEQQYAARLPHRAITPETIVFQANGEPMLLASPGAGAEHGEAADVHALACVVHYAICGEWQPGAPLGPLQLEGYSDSLIGAIDKCLASDPRQRPQTIEQLRNLLGIVAPGPAPVAAPQAVPPAAAVAAAPVRRAASASRLRRWLPVGLAACVLLAAVAGMVALLPGNGPGDGVALSLPPPHPASALEPKDTLVPPAAQQRAADRSTAIARAAGTGPAPQAPAAPQPGQPTSVAPAAPASSPAAGEALSAPAPAAAAGPGTAYKLLIRPWGTVYVDGQDRGASPPLKRLLLAPGPHTVRIVNPNFPDRVLRIEAGKSASGRIVHNFSTASR